MIKLVLVALSIMICLCANGLAADLKSRASFQEPQDRQESQSKAYVSLPGPPGPFWYAPVTGVKETNLNVGVLFPPRQIFVLNASRNTEGHATPGFKHSIPYDCWHCWAFALGFAIQDSIASHHACPKERHKANFSVDINADRSLSTRLIYSSFSRADTERLQQAISSLSGERVLAFPTVANIEPDLLKSLSNEYKQKYNTTFDVQPGPLSQATVQINIWSPHFHEDEYPIPKGTSLTNWQ